jgi:hypothetical protein
MHFNSVELVKGYALPKSDGGVDYGSLHAYQRYAAFAGFDDGPGIPGPVGRASPGVPAYVTQTLPALNGYGSAPALNPPSGDTPASTPSGPPAEVKRGALFALLAGTGLLLAFNMLGASR